jgi:hypothetical protein
MRVSTEETERPTEWLRSFQEDAALYFDLVTETGSLALAAYRLARARCRVQPVPTFIPTATELMAAALDLSRRVAPGAKEPIPSLVLADCESAGYTVICPIPRAA